MSEPRVTRVRARSGALLQARPGDTIADLARLRVTAQAVSNAIKFDNIAFDPPLQPGDLQKLHKAGGKRRGATLLRPRHTKRPCMCCRQPFPSEGAHNRLCNDCRTDPGPFAP